MVQQFLLEKLINLIRQNTVDITHIKNEDYKRAVKTHFEEEFLEGKITEEEYKRILKQ